MSDFIVRFHGVELSREHAERVQASIQKAVLAEVPSSSLATYTPDPDGSDSSGAGTLVFLPNHIWRGIIYLPAALLQQERGALNAQYRVVAE